MRSKKIMILGAGSFQLPAIRKAVELGYYTITVDYLPDNMGHKISHQYVNCSTVDRDGILKAAKDLQIDGICTFSSDVAIPTVGYVCESLGLLGVSTNAAEILATKHRFRAFQQENGLNCPHFLMARSLDEVWNGLNNLSFPVMFKPVDTSGSRGVSKLERPNRLQVETAFNYAQSFSRSGIVCIEEFLEGVETSGDGILVDGRFAFIGITHKRVQNFVVMGHSLPSNISQKDRERIAITLENCCQILGYTDGPLDFDVMVAPDKITIIEMSPRNGGNGIPSVIERATGIDLEVGALKLAMGDAVSFPSQFELLRGAGSLIFGSSERGILRSILDKERLSQAVPEVFDLSLAVHPGEEVFPLEHNGNAIGYALFDCEDAIDYDRVSKEILQALRIDIAKQE